MCRVSHLLHPERKMRSGLNWKLVLSRNDRPCFDRRSPHHTVGVGVVAAAAAAAAAAALFDN